MGEFKDNVFIENLRAHTITRVHNMEKNNKRIFKNTAYLYVRQLVIMGLSFFTTRIVLEKLGAGDFGVNNVVAGFVSMFTLVNSILQTSTSRFLSLNLGKIMPN